MADLYLTPAERYTAALGGFYYGDLPEPGTAYTQLIKDILDGATPDKEPKNILARFIYSLYISDLGDPYPRYELAKLLYWKLHDITPTKSGSILTVTIDGKEDYMTINTDLSRLWYKVLFGSKTDVITEFPYIFNTMQNKLSDWELFGNVEVSGTPTSDSPVMPQGTGERTGNLYPLDASKLHVGRIENDGTIDYEIGTLTVGTNSVTYEANATWRGFYTDFIQVNENEKLTFSPNDSAAIAWSCNCYDENGNFLGKAPAQSVAFIRTFALLTGTKKVRISVTSSDTTYTISRPMLNSGSTALPYEPYGYKIPISSADTTTPVYLGEVETTRKIKKYEFTGNEGWGKGNYAPSGGYQFFTPKPSDIANNPDWLMTHFKKGSGLNGSAFASYLSLYPEASILPENATANDFKEWLAAQYAAGTPVTVWYVLANEETGIVDEPLMKIGEYADSMSRTQTGIDIPTVVGRNTLDVLTTVKPSSMSIEYTSADENRSRSKRISLLKSPLKKGLIEMQQPRL